MELEKETRKFLDRYTEPNRASNGDVPIGILMKALKDAVEEYKKDKKSFDFVKVLSGDIRLELVASAEADDIFYGLVSQLEDIVGEDDEFKNLLKKIEEYIEEIINAKDK